jgi:hypothetical protein
LNSCDIHAILFNQKELSNSGCNNVLSFFLGLKRKFMQGKEAEYFIENRYGAGYKILLTIK